MLGQKQRQRAAVFPGLRRGMEEQYQRHRAVSARSAAARTAANRQVNCLEIFIHKNDDVRLHWTNDCIGIAVSGGADSMALAYLCKQLQVTKPELNLVVKAFIIDHKAREESSEEAHMVKNWLSNLGEP